MAKPSADVPKFKKLEKTMRSVPNSVRSAIEEIDRLLEVRRSPEEIERLKALREQAAMMHAVSKTFYGMLMELYR